LRKILFLLLAASMVLSARTNPFKDAVKEDITGADMAQINKIEKLQSITITPPVDSVKIKKITIEFQAIDGSRIKKTYDIEKGIDPLKSLNIHQ